MLDTVAADLTLQGLLLGPREEPLDLSRLLYKGAASTHEKNVRKAIESGQLGRPQMERLPLLVEIHRHWQAAIAAKTLAEWSIRERWRALKNICCFAETNNKPLTTTNVLNLYLAYCEYTKRRKDIKPETKYSYSQTLAMVIAPVLGTDANKLQWKTKIAPPKRTGSQTAKESLDSTASFVQTMLHTISHLSDEAIRGPLPVVLSYPSGNEHMIHCGLELRPTDSLKTDAYKLKRALECRERRLNDTSNRARARLINLRIDAELLIFINQTSSNLTQALQLTADRFSFQSDRNYYRVYAWKGRARHDVELRIEKSYRPHFEEYLKWRAAIFPNDQDGLTFPFVWNDGDKAMQRTSWGFPEARKLMKAIGQPFVNSQQLRKTVGNFVKRNASRQTAAELLSNTEKTFRDSYEEVHHQTSTRELVRFWAEVEGSVGVLAVGPGACLKPQPQLHDDAPAGSPKPDCEGGAGCLFCDKNRDLRSFDHVWNLTSFHHLKLAEFNADRTPFGRKNNHPAALTIERVAAKLDALKALSGECAEWVEEARFRVQEGRYHPFYSAAFNILEGGR